MRRVFARWNLKVNASKTEFIDIVPGGFQKLKNKKLGSRLSDGEDMKHRINQALVAFGKMWKVWLNSKYIKLDTRIRLYNACIKPIMTYNMGASGATDSKLETMDRAHRRQLRQVLGVYYPNHISSKNLYAVCKVEKLSVTPSDGSA
jgi:hypothetical protein